MTASSPSSALEYATQLLRDVMFGVPRYGPAKAFWQFGFADGASPVVMTQHNFTISQARTHSAKQISDGFEGVICFSTLDPSAGPRPGALVVIESYDTHAKSGISLSLPFRGTLLGKLKPSTETPTRTEVPWLTA